MITNAAITLSNTVPTRVVTLSTLPQDLHAVSNPTGLVIGVLTVRQD